MNPLVDEYLKRDLTEVEEQQLADGLAASPEDARRLAEGLADLYLKSGLPEPIWPGGTLPPFQKKRGWLKLWIPSLLILLLLGFSAYQWFTHTAAPTPVAAAPFTPGPEILPAKKIHSLSKAVEKTQKQIQEKITVRPSSSAVEAQPLSASSLELPSLSSEPVPQTGHLYEQLSVVVEPTAASLATVRVLDRGGNELKTLFAGIIPAGRRTFTWDGKTAAGTVAPPGTYFIEVKSGQRVMRQEVKVEGN